MATKLEFYSELVYGDKTNFIHHDKKMQLKIKNKLRFMSKPYQELINDSGFILIPKSLEHLNEFALRYQEIEDDIEILDFFNYYFAYGYEQFEQHLTLGFVDEELQEPLETALSKCINQLQDFTDEELQGIVIKDFTDEELQGIIIKDFTDEELQGIIKEPTTIDEDDLNPTYIPLTDDEQIDQKVENLHLEQVKHLTRTPVQFVDVEELPESTKEPVIEKKQHRKPEKRLKDCNFTKINDNTLYYHIEDGYYYNDFTNKEPNQKDTDEMYFLREDKIKLLEQGVILVYSGGVGSGKTTDATRIVKEWALKDDYLPFIRTNRTGAKEQIDNIVWWRFDDNGNRVIVDEPNDNDGELYFKFEIPLDCYQAGFKEINTSKNTKILYHWDEPHYIIADSQFNKKTDEAYQELHNIIESGQSLLITSANCKDFMLKVAKKYPNRKFLIIDKKDNFSYVNNFFYYYKETSLKKIIDKAKGKVVIGSNEMKTWRELKKLEEEMGIKVAYVQSKNEPKIPDNFDKLTIKQQKKIIKQIKNWCERQVLVERTEKLIRIEKNNDNDNTHYEFDADVLCFTSAWDTAVSIIDTSITDIINELQKNPYSGYQELGRVRIQDGQTVNFHIKILKRDNFLKRLDENPAYQIYKQANKCEVEDVQFKKLYTKMWSNDFTTTQTIYNKDELLVFLKIENLYEIRIKQLIDFKDSDYLSYREDYKNLQKLNEQLKILHEQKDDISTEETIDTDKLEQIQSEIEDLQEQIKELREKCKPLLIEINNSFRRIYLEEYIRKLILRDYDCFFKSYESWYNEQFGSESEKQERLDKEKERRIQLIEEVLGQELKTDKFKELATQLNFKDSKYRLIRKPWDEIEALGYKVEKPSNSKRFTLITK